jgi:hypothetical protein
MQYLPVPIRRLAHVPQGQQQAKNPAETAGIPCLVTRQTLRYCKFFESSTQFYIPGKHSLKELSAGRSIELNVTLIQEIVKLNPIGEEYHCFV